MKCINRGGLTLPTKKWLKHYKSMDAFFHSYHPKNKIKSGRGLFRKFFLELKKKFPIYDDNVLHLVTRVLTRFRIRNMNKRASYLPRSRKLPKGFELKFKNKRKAPITLRGKVQLANRVQ